MDGRERKVRSPLYSQVRRFVATAGSHCGSGTEQRGGVDVRLVVIFVIYDSSTITEYTSCSHAKPECS